MGFYANRVPTKWVSFFRDYRCFRRLTMVHPQECVSLQDTQKCIKNIEIIDLTDDVIDLTTIDSKTGSISTTSSDIGTGLEWEVDSKGNEIPDSLFAFDRKKPTDDENVIDMKDIVWDHPEDNLWEDPWLQNLLNKRTILSR